MKISVVTVVYNGAETLEDAINSVAAQSHPDVEHIIIDGGSTDGTLEIIDRHKHRLGQIVSEGDDGLYDAMNKGLALAQGEIIGTLNSDDLYAHPSVLSQVAAVFEDRSVDACYADLVYVDRATADCVVRYWRSSSFRQGLFASAWCPPHPTFFVRKAIYEKFGKYDLSFRLAADNELMMRFLEAKKVPTRYIPRVWVKMRLGGTTNNSFRNMVEQNIEIARAAQIHNVPFSLPVFLAKKVLDRLRQFYTRPAGDQ